MNTKNTPDKQIAWDELNYSDYSEYNRPEPGFKRCSKCHKLKAVNTWNFGKSKSSIDGYQYVCKECAKVQQQQYRLKKGHTPRTS